ncbi:hypothetical protein BRD15_00545 [Halobacteriales archaeon SW_6_65_15]|nr:MAG: hypothetical protein BRD15_00545 [Halobacteriales archaeon SW_6_65_15]
MRAVPLVSSVEYANPRIRYFLSESRGFFCGFLVSNLRKDFYELVDAGGEHCPRLAKVMQPVDYLFTLVRADAGEPRKQCLFAEKHDDGSPFGGEKSVIRMVSQRLHLARLVVGRHPELLLAVFRADSSTADEGVPLVFRRIGKFRQLAGIPVDVLLQLRREILVGRMGVI